MLLSPSPAAGFSRQGPGVEGSCRRLEPRSPELKRPTLRIAMTHHLKAWSIVVAVVAACCALSAQEPDRSDTEALSRRAAERLKTLHEEAERLASQEKTLLGEL